MLSGELKRLGTSLLALSEVQWLTSSEGCTYWSRCSNGSHIRGVAVAIFDRFLSSVTKVTPVDERIMLVRLKLSLGFISLVSVLYLKLD